MEYRPVVVFSMMPVNAYTRTHTSLDFSKKRKSSGSSKCLLVSALLGFNVSRYPGSITSSLDHDDAFVFSALVQILHEDIVRKDAWKLFICLVLPGCSKKSSTDCASRLCILVVGNIRLCMDGCMNCNNNIVITSNSDVVPCSL